jgi:hypothetical protein
MQTTFSFGGGNPRNPFSSLISLVILIAVLVGLFFLVSGFIKLLYLIAPVLLIITLIINYRVVADYVLDIGQTFQTDILFGMVKVAFAVFCYPIVIGWLLAKALIYRKVDKIQKNFQTQMDDMQRQMGAGASFGKPYAEEAEFEEMPNDPNTADKTDKTPKISLFEPTKTPKSKDSDDYDQFFK